MIFYDLVMISIFVQLVWQDICDVVVCLCDDFLNEYWFKLDVEDFYLYDFVKVFMDFGFFGVLILEEYGGFGLLFLVVGVVLEMIYVKGCNVVVCYVQMYIMGIVFKYGFEEQK